MTQRELQDLAEDYQLKTTAARCGYELKSVDLLDEEIGLIGITIYPIEYNEFTPELCEPWDFNESWKAQTTSYGSLVEDDYELFVNACDNGLTMVQVLNDFYARVKSYYN